MKHLPDLKDLTMRYTMYARGKHVPYRHGHPVQHVHFLLRQEYLAIKKTPLLRTLQQACAWGPVAVLGGWQFSTSGWRRGDEAVPISPAGCSHR